MFIYLNFFVVFIIVILINYKRKLNYTMKDKEFLLGNAYRYGYASLVSVNIFT